MLSFLINTAYAQGADPVTVNLTPDGATQATNSAIQTATTTAHNAQQLVTSIDWSTPSWDLFIILFFVVAALLYGMSLGRDRIVTILVGIYMSLAVINYAPFINSPVEANVGIENIFVIKVSSFLAVFVALFFILSRSALMNTIAGSSDNAGTWWQIMVFSILHVGLLIAVVMSFLPKEFVDGLAPFTKQVFTGDTALFWWIMAPIIAMCFAKKKIVDSLE